MSTYCHWQLQSVVWSQVDGDFPSTTRTLQEEGNLTIVHLNHDDAGVYECIATNIVARTITTALLIIHGINRVELMRIAVSSVCSLLFIGLWGRGHATPRGVRVCGCSWMHVVAQCKLPVYRRPSLYIFLVAEPLKRAPNCLSGLRSWASHPSHVSCRRGQSHPCLEHYLREWMPMNNCGSR